MLPQAGADKTGGDWGVWVISSKAITDERARELVAAYVAEMEGEK
jgi:hypothetical protein